MYKYPFLLFGLAMLLFSHCDAQNLILQDIDLNYKVFMPGSKLTFEGINEKGFEFQIDGILKKYTQDQIYISPIRVREFKGGEPVLQIESPTRLNRLYGKEMALHVSDIDKLYKIKHEYVKPWGFGLIAGGAVIAGAGILTSYLDAGFNPFYNQSDFDFNGQFVGAMAIYGGLVLVLTSLTRKTFYIRPADSKFPPTKKPYTIYNKF